MRVFKHSFLSLMRKPTKAMMILIILFVVFSLVFTGVIIQNSISQSKEFIRLGLGAVVEYKADYMKAYKDNVSNEAYDQMALSKSTADAIGSDKRVEKVYINYQDGVESKTYKNVSKSNSGGNFEGDSGSAMVALEVSSFGVYFNLKASNSGEAIEFDTDKVSISKGRNINEADASSDEHVIVVSEEFASKNDLSLDDEMILKSFATNSNIVYKIVGLYKVNAKEITGNDFYVSPKSIVVEGSESISNIYFKLKDPLVVDAFIKDQSVNLPSEYLVLDAGNSEFKKLTKPLDLMSMIASILIWVVFIAGAAIVLSLITIFVRDRKFEVGLLLASGESRIKIICQFVIEITIVAVIAFGCSMLLSQQSSQLVSDWIVENQLIEKEDETSNDMFFMMGEGNVNGDVQMENVAKDFDVAITFDVMKNLFIISIGIVLIASLIPLAIILSYNPRQALQD